MSLRRIPGLSLASLLAVYGCSGSDNHRKNLLLEAGTDGGPVNSGAGGKLGAGGANAATGGARATGGAGAGGVTTGTGGGASGGVAPADAGPDTSVPGSAVPDASLTDAGTGTPPLGEFCDIQDPVLDSAVRSAVTDLGLDGGAPTGPIPVALASRIASLYVACDCSDVIDFTGVECLTGLESLSIDGQYSRLDLAGKLPSLRELTVAELGNGNLDFLSNFPNIQKFTANSYDQLTDLTALAALTKLTDLDISDNLITDLGPLTSLTELVSLNVSGNQIVSLTPLAGLTKLETLNAKGNQIAVFTTVSGLTNLTDLDVGHNAITTLLPIAGLTKLTRFSSEQDAITDLGPIAGLTSLNYLDIISSQRITNLSPLVTNTGLGAGDTIYGSLDAADCGTLKADIQTLTDRGLLLQYFPNCP